MHSKFVVHMNIRSVFLRAKLAMHHIYIPVLIQYTVILNGNMMYVKEKLQGQWTSAKNPILVIIKRVFKKLGFEYVNLLYLALSRTFNLQIIQLFLSLHSIYIYIYIYLRLLVRILNSSMPTIEMRSRLMNAKFNYLFRAYTSMIVFFFFFFNILFTDSVTPQNHRQ